MGLSIWALLENLKGGSLTRDFERQMEGTGHGVSPSLCGSLVRGTWKEGCFTGDPEGYVK